MRLPAIAGIALVAAATSAAAAPLPTTPVPAPDGSICAPGTATVTTPRGTWEVTPTSTTCRGAPDPETGAPGALLVADGAILWAGTPRITLRAGDPVTVRFAGAPLEVVRLDARSGPSARATTRRYRLSPFTTRWRARAGSGLLVITAWVPAPPAIAADGRILAVYSVAYRAAARR